MSKRLYLPDSIHPSASRLCEPIHPPISHSLCSPSMGRPCSWLLSKGESQVVSAGLQFEVGVVTSCCFAVDPLNFSSFCCIPHFAERDKGSWHSTPRFVFEHIQLPQTAAKTPLARSFATIVPPSSRRALLSTDSSLCYYFEVCSASRLFKGIDWRL
ncbi:uncharacterized protein UTRI_00965 [Ustilago trichophora]|uniref:Uncharacterized protein n=1 Tax=Ustilago trichophora TaxID=86804 RepID=A0A5C3DY70_9BASI|nr:uncharacterized protein UTRI_00965 [Ustilago trichophora]